MSFGDNLKKVRELRGYSAPDVISKTGIGKTKYYAWEGAKYEPGPEIVDQLAEFFNVPREIFYKKEVLEEDLNPRERSFKDEIFEGDYIGIHKLVWASYEHGVNHDRRMMEKLVDSLAEAVRKLAPTG